MCCVFACVYVHVSMCLRMSAQCLCAHLRVFKFGMPVCVCEYVFVCVSACVFRNGKEQHAAASEAWHTHGMIHIDICSVLLIARSFCTSISTCTLFGSSTSLPGPSYVYTYEILCLCVPEAERECESFFLLLSRIDTC